MDYLQRKNAQHRSRKEKEGKRAFFTLMGMISCIGCAVVYLYQNNESPGQSTARFLEFVQVLLFIRFLVI